MLFIPESSIQEGRAFIQDALDQFHNPTFTTVRCTAGNINLFIDNIIRGYTHLASCGPPLKT